MELVKEIPGEKIEQFKHLMREYLYSYRLTESDLCRKISLLLGEYLLNKEHEYNIPYLLQHAFWAVKLLNDPPAYKTTRVELEYVLECLEGKREFSQDELDNLLKDYYKKLKDDWYRYDSGTFWNKLFRRLRIAKQ
jgi:hypothetical protein